MAARVLKATPSEKPLMARQQQAREDERAAAEYRAMLERNADLRPSPLLNNSTPLQFVTAANFLLERARHRACIFSDCLSRYSDGSGDEQNSESCVRQIWAGVANSAQQFLRRNGTQLDILVRGLLDTPTSPEIHELLNAAITDLDRKGTITLRIARDKKITWPALFQWNYMVVDGCDFRYEVNGGMPHALLQFGNPKLGNKFESMYDRMAAVIDHYADPKKHSKLLISLFYNEDDRIPSEGRCKFGGQPPYPWDKCVEARSFPPPSEYECGVAA